LFNDGGEGVEMLLGLAVELAEVYAPDKATPTFPVRVIQGAFQ